MTYFKKKLTTLAVCAAVMVSANVNAATDTTFTLTGDFKPAACVPTLENGGTVDFGKMNTTKLSTATGSTGLVQLGRKSINLTITCDAAASVGILTQDNRSSSKVDLSATAYIENGANDSKNIVNTDVAFGLGTTDDGKSIGVYSLRAIIAGTTVDGVASDLIYKNTTPTESAWTRANDGVLYPDNGRVLSAADTGSLVPKYFTEMTVPLYITAAVQTKDKLGSGSEVKMDGNATISLVYL
ncbi:DUF1120 domain-containing protein [Enterobacter asburiae]|nr:DUF1120 domain-containing protein [Enterobacter asburiae]